MPTDTERCTFTWLADPSGFSPDKIDCIREAGHEQPHKDGTGAYRHGPADTKKLTQAGIVAGTLKPEGIIRSCLPNPDKQSAVVAAGADAIRAYGEQQRAEGADRIHCAELRQKSYVAGCKAGAADENEACAKASHHRLLGELPGSGGYFAAVAIDAAIRARREGK